jgi:hypothetical protein
MRVIRTRTATGTPGGLRERCVEEAIVVLVIGKVRYVVSAARGLWLCCLLCGFVPFWRALAKDLGLCKAR